MTDLSTHPMQAASAWLADFSSALTRNDVDAAVALFEPESYWRDLVAFTWNIRTMEGKDQVRDMLDQQLAQTQPSNWAVAKGEDATEANGIVEGWITFETNVARGFGHVRLA